MKTATRAEMEAHYADLSAKGFFAGLVNYMISGPVVCMVWEGKDVIAGGRKLLGATKPSESLCGTIRGDFAIDVGRNICHGSDLPESAAAEIAMWSVGSALPWARGLAIHTCAPLTTHTCTPLTSDCPLSLHTRATGSPRASMPGPPTATPGSTSKGCSCTAL